MRRSLVLLFVLIATSVLGVQPSRAQFAECTQEYIDGFRVPAWSWYPGQIACHEFWRFSFSTPAGRRWIRLIGEEELASSIPSGGVETLRETALRATRRYDELGSYLVDDITMLIGPQTADVGDVANNHAAAWATRASGESEGRFDECHVTVVLGATYEARDIHHAVGHELFHCVEHASLSRAQFGTYATTGKWWAEGSADAFGSVVANSARGVFDRTAHFEAAVSVSLPLYEMGYNAKTFFLWFIQEKGLGQLLPFLRQMSATDSNEAQMAAMAAAMPQSDWTAFAQAYDDRRIRGPDGAPLPFGEPVEGTTWMINGESATILQELRRFVIETGWAHYQCGVWENRANDPSVEVRREDSREWNPWSGELDTNNRGDVRLRVISMVSGPAAVDFQLEADKRASCSDCQISRVIDRCVVGRWRQTGGGPIEYLRSRLGSRGVPMTIIADQTELVLTMNDDGTFSTNDIETDAEVEVQGPHGTLQSRGTGRTTAVTGRWSAADGELLGCIDSGGELQGETRFPDPGPRADEISRRAGLGPYNPVSPWSGSAAGTSGAATYECSDTTLSTSSPTEHGPMTYTFARETPPPRRR